MTIVVFLLRPLRNFHWRSKERGMFGKDKLSGIRRQFEQDFRHRQLYWVNQDRVVALMLVREGREFFAILCYVVLIVRIPRVKMYWID